MEGPNEVKDAYLECLENGMSMAFAAEKRSVDEFRVDVGVQGLILHATRYVVMKCVRLGVRVGLCEKC